MSEVSVDTPGHPDPEPLHHHEAQAIDEAVALALVPARGPLPAGDSEVALTGEPLDLVFDDPVLELVRPLAGSRE